MGKSYSYSIVVEQNDRLLINDQDIAVPSEVTATGDDPLGWALEQVRQMYATYYTHDEDSQLSLSVDDHRQGIKRKAVFSHPDGGIDLATFLGESRSPDSTSADEEDREGPAEDSPEQSRPDVEELPPSSAGSAAPNEGSGEARNDDRGVQSGKDAAVEVEAIPHESSEAYGDFAAEEEMAVAAESKNGVSHEPSTAAAADRHEGSAYEKKMRTERGWKKLDAGKSNRPQVGSAENEGESKRKGLLAEDRRQKTFMVVGAVILIALVVVGFRVFGGGTAYEAVCVDQRTMTRAVTGVACEDAGDTNHRWWYTDQVDDVPAVGDTINRESGTFEEPTGGGDTITRHMEGEDG